jgi:uncharacterized membrane protein YfhO
MSKERRVIEPYRTRWRRFGIVVALAPVLQILSWILFTIWAWPRYVNKFGGEFGPPANFIELTIWHSLGTFGFTHYAFIAFVSMSGIFLYLKPTPFRFFFAVAMLLLLLAVIWLSTYVALLFYSFRY